MNKWEWKNIDLFTRNNIVEGENTDKKTREEFAFGHEKQHLTFK